MSNKVKYEKEITKLMPNAKKLADYVGLTVKEWKAKYEADFIALRDRYDTIGVPNPDLREIQSANPNGDKLTIFGVKTSANEITFKMNISELEKMDPDQSYNIKPIILAIVEGKIGHHKEVYSDDTPTN